MFKTIRCYFKSLTVKRDRHVFRFMSVNNVNTPKVNVVVDS